MSTTTVMVGQHQTITTTSVVCSVLGGLSQKLPV